MAESWPWKTCSSSGESLRRARTAMRRTSSSESDIGAAASLRLGVVGLVLEPVEDGAHDPLLLGMGDDVDLALVEEDPAAVEAGLDVQAAQPHLVHLHPALGTVHPVQLLQ